MGPQIEAHKRDRWVIAIEVRTGIAAVAAPADWDESEWTYLIGKHLPELGVDLPADEQNDPIPVDLNYPHIWSARLLERVRGEASPTAEQAEEAQVAVLEVLGGVGA